MDIPELLSSIGDNFSVRRSFGTAYEQDGVIVIPVALVAGGGGGGGDTGAKPDPQSDAGGGFGGVVVPMGVYVVKDGEVRWESSWDAILLLLVGFRALRFISRLFARTRARRRARF
jgi:uncharacterized spore protein YtfJ